MLTANSFKRRKLAHAIFTKSEQAVCLLPNGMLDATPRTEHYASITERNARESPLLRLPPYLRDRIWELVMSLDNALRSSSNGCSAWGIPLPPAYLAPLRVCRQMYTETALLPFTLTSLCNTPEAGFIVAVHSKTEQRTLIRNRTLWCPCILYQCWVSDTALQHSSTVNSVQVVCRRGVRNRFHNPAEQAAIASKVKELIGDEDVGVSFT